MAKVAYSEKEREQVREALVATGLELMSKQGIQHTTVEQIYKRVGISRTFFYTFFPTKEDFIVEILYLQQPKLIAYARKLKDDPALSWRNSLTKFLNSLCYGPKYGILVLKLEEQQFLFKRLTEKSRAVFREKQFHFFNMLLQIWGIDVDMEQVKLILNLSIITVITSRVSPDMFPFLLPESTNATVAFQVETLIDYLETLKKKI